MSSILDALRKLEEEKAQQFPAPETPLPIEPPAREPALRRTRSRRSVRGAHSHSRKLWFAVPVGILALGIIWAVASTGPSPGDDPDLVAAARPAPSVSSNLSSDAARRDSSLERIEAELRRVAESPTHEAPAAGSETSLTAKIQRAETEMPMPAEPSAEDSAPDEANAEPNIVTANARPIQVDVKPVPMEVEPEPEPIDLPEPESEPPVDVASQPAEPEPIEPEPVEEAFEMAEEPAPTRVEVRERYQNAMMVSDALRGGTEEEPEFEPSEQDIRRYAIMTRTERTRLGIPDLVVNMLGLPNERQPRPSALINYNNVYVGETIPDTQGRAHLIGVDIRGIAIEVDGERFYYPK